MTLERPHVSVAARARRPQCDFWPVILRLNGGIAHALGIDADDPVLATAARAVFDGFSAQGIPPTSRHEHRYRAAILRRFGAERRRPQGSAQQAPDTGAAPKGRRRRVVEMNRTGP